MALAERARVQRDPSRIVQELSRSRALRVAGACIEIAACGTIAFIGALYFWHFIAVAAPLAYIVGMLGLSLAASGFVAEGVLILRRVKEGSK